MEPDTSTTTTRRGTGRVALIPGSQGKRRPPRVRPWLASHERAGRDQLSPGFCASPCASCARSACSHGVRRRGRSANSVRSMDCSPSPACARSRRSAQVRAASASSSGAPLLCGPGCRSAAPARARARVRAARGPSSRAGVDACERVAGASFDRLRTFGDTGSARTDGFVAPEPEAAGVAGCPFGALDALDALDAPEAPEAPEVPAARRSSTAWYSRSTSQASSAASAVCCCPSTWASSPSSRTASLGSCSQPRCASVLLTMASAQTLNSCRSAWPKRACSA